MQIYRVGIFVVVLSILTVLCGWVPISYAADAPLRISAVQISGGVGKTNEDYIELFNPNPHAVNLNGMRLVKRAELSTSDTAIKAWSTDTWVPAYSHYLWANSTFTAIPTVPDTTTTATLSDNNGVALRRGLNDTGMLQDSIAWGSANNAFRKVDVPNPGAGESIVLANVFSGAEYRIAVSSPRNTSSQQLPGADESPIIDDAQCSADRSIVAVGPGQPMQANISFVNTGSSTWMPALYVVNGSDASTTPIVASTAPSGTVKFTMEVVSPVDAGEYQYVWQMSNQGTLFGESCVVVATVALPPEVLSPASAPLDGSIQTAQTIKITEFLPNPSGSDDGQEKIELHNYGTGPIDLTGWVLDDASTTETLSDNALVLPETQLNAGEYLVITLAESSFSLNNTGGDVLSLFNKNKQLIDTVLYTNTASENISYAVMGESWDWVESSLGQPNPVIVPTEVQVPIIQSPVAPETSVQVVPNDLTGLIISEIYSNPSKNTFEFVELYNGTSRTIKIKGGYLHIANKKIVLPDISILPDAYAVITKDNAALQLANAGKQITLFDEQNRQIDTITYPQLPKGSSYSLFEDNFIVTLDATPGAKNILELTPVLPKASPASIKVNKTSKAVATVKTSKAKPKSTVSVKKSGAVEVEKKVGNESPAANMPIEHKQNAETKEKPKGVVNIVALGLATISAGGFALYKFGIMQYF